MEPTVKLTGFELIELIGKGGIGAVWKARQLSLDRIVAIKLLLPEFERDKEENRRLVLEARTAARLKHAGIVQVYDANEENGVFFIVMEYVAGYSVGTWLRRKQKLSEADALTVGIAVSDALDYAWRTAKLIHCDIKPDNIMVDTDGAIKVADLGLSRTFDTRADAQGDDVLGTPSYMAPEQVEGHADVDCRTDIYALGATMYHMVTGHRPFQEVPDRKAADLQISGHLSDAIELNPALTPAFCAVLEKMLAKKRDDRYTRWYEVGGDLRLVLAHKALQTPLLAPGASTMQRSPKRSLHPIRIAAQAGKWMLIGGLIVIVLLAVMLLAKPQKVFVKPVSKAVPITMAPKVPPPFTPVDGHSATPDPATNTSAASADLAAYGAWQTWSWHQSNLRDYDGSIARLTEVIRRYPGSEGAAKAGHMLTTVRKLREDAMRLAWERLETEAGDLARKQQYVEAARLLDAYAGPCAAALQTNRTALAETYRVSDAKRQDAQRTQDEQTLLNRLGARLSTGDCVAAHAEIAARLADMPAPSASLRDKLMCIATVINAASNVEARVLNTFAAQTGQSVTVEMVPGSQLLQIVAVEGRRVRARTTGVEAEIGFGVAELSTAERERRLSLLNDDAAWLRRGVAAASENNMDAARTAFEKIGPPLGPLLLGQFDEHKLSTEAQAQAAWHAILEEVGLNSGAGGDDAVTPDAVGRLLLSVGLAGKTTKRLQAFHEQFGSSLVARRAAPVFNALERECERMTKDVGDRGLAPAAGPVMRGAALKRALLDANPDMEQRDVNFEEQNGRVVAIHVRTDLLKDLSPLTQADSLREVSLEPVERNPLVVDLKALTRLPKLDTLRLTHVSVPDPTVLADLKLQDLTVERAGLRDLQWTKKLALRRLNLSGNNRIKDFTPLRSMEGLESLCLDDTGLVNLDGLPLRRLHELGVSRTFVRDFSMLREAPLNRLDVAGLKITDWSWLRGLALKYLNVSDSNFRELTLLNRMPLQVLIMRNTGVKDLSALNGLPLVQLDMSGTALQDLTQLRGLRLDNLSLARTRVTSSSLGNLSGMPLHYLDLSETAVADLKALKDLPLIWLYIEGTGVKDLTPLNGTSIEFLRVTVDDKQHTLRGLRTGLRGWPSLKQVNGIPVDAVLRGE